MIEQTSLVCRVYRQKKLTKRNGRRTALRTRDNYMGNGETELLFMRCTK